MKLDEEPFESEDFPNKGAFGSNRFFHDISIACLGFQFQRFEVFDQ